MKTLLALIVSISFCFGQGNYKTVVQSVSTINQDSIVFVVGNGQATIYKDGHIKRLPSITNNAGKYIRVNGTATGWELATPAGSGDALTANPLSQFAATTSAQLSGVLTDEVGTLGGYLRQSSTKLGSDYTNSTTTGTEVTGLQISSTGTGILCFEYWLLVQSAATTTGWKFGVNHTGTATVLAINMTYPSTGGAAATGVGEDVVANNTGSIYEAAAARTVSTTSPNLGPTAGVAAATTNILVKISGMMDVTVSGDLELWAGSEVAASQITVKQNSIATAYLK